MQGATGDHSDHHIFKLKLGIRYIVRKLQVKVGVRTGSLNERQWRQGDHPMRLQQTNPKSNQPFTDLICASKRMQLLLVGGEKQNRLFSATSVNFLHAKYFYGGLICHNTQLRRQSSHSTILHLIFIRSYFVIWPVAWSRFGDCAFKQANYCNTKTLKCKRWQAKAT